MFTVIEIFDQVGKTHYDWFNQPGRGVSASGTLCQLFSCHAFHVEMAVHVGLYELHVPPRICHAEIVHVTREHSCS